MQLKTLMTALIIASVQPVVWGMEKEPQTKELQIQIDYEIKDSADAQVKKGTCVHSLAELAQFKNIYDSTVLNTMISIALLCKLPDKLLADKQYIKYKVLSKHEYIIEGAKTSLKHLVRQKTMVPITDTGYFTHLCEGKMSKIEVKIIKN
jgi:hypothetical protein